MSDEKVTNKKVTKRGAAKFLRESAKLIEKHGWVKHKYGGPESGFCALGAMMYLEEHAHDDNYYVRVSAVLTMSDVCTNGKYLSEWNDYVAQNKENVIKSFRKAARYLEHGGKLSKPSCV